jgi:hypothetical protein
MSVCWFHIRRTRLHSLPTKASGSHVSGSSVGKTIRKRDRDEHRILTTRILPVLLFRIRTRRALVSLCFFNRNIPVGEGLYIEADSGESGEDEPTPRSFHSLLSSDLNSRKTLHLTACIVSSSSSPSPSSSWVCEGSSFTVSSSPPSTLPSGCGVDSDDLSVVAGENKLSLGFVDGAPKLNAEPDDPGIVVSPALGDELPNPNPTGFPILPAGFPKANAPVLGGEALPKTLTGWSERKMLADVEEDVIVTLPKRVVVALELFILSESEGVELNGDGLLDSILLLPNIELPNTDVGLDVASEVPNRLVGLVVVKKFGTLPEPRLGAVEVGRELVDGPSVSWLEEPGTDLDVVFSMPKGAANKKPEVGGRLDVAADAFEAGNAKADFGGSGGVLDEDADGSLGLGVTPKGNCAGAELEGGTKGGNVKPPVFVPFSLIEESLGDDSTDPTGGFGMENNEVVFSGGGLPLKGGEELVVTGPRTVDGCESNSDRIVVRRFL